MTESITPEPIQEPVSVDDNASSLTVDNAGLTELASAIDTELQVDVVGALPAGTNAIGKLAANSGVDIGDVDVTSIAAGDNNIGNVDIVTVPAPLSTTGGGTEATAHRVTIASDSTGVLSVDDNGGALTVDNAGTFAVQDATVAGHVDGIEALLGTIDTDTGNIATSAAILDNAIFVDDADWTADTSSHTLVGAVTEAAPLTRTDGDTHPLATDLFGHLRVGFPETDLANASSSHVKKYYTSAGAATDGIIWSPAAGKRWYVQTMYINVSAAATVTLEDDLAGGDSPVFKSEFAAKSGVAINFNPPLYSGEDAADLIITTDTGNVYVTVTGYEI